MLRRCGKLEGEEKKSSSSTGVKQFGRCLLQGPAWPGLAAPMLQLQLRVLHVSLTESEESEAPITTALMVQEEAENTSVEEDSPPCEGGNDAVVSRYVSTRMVWINIH